MCDVKKLKRQHKETTRTLIILSKAATCYYLELLSSTRKKEQQNSNRIRRRGRRCRAQQQRRPMSLSAVQLGSDATRSLQMRMRMRMARDEEPRKLNGYEEHFRPNRAGHIIGLGQQQPAAMAARTFAMGLVCLLVAALMLEFVPGANCVDCFKCSSRNGSNPDCEDPFHNLKSARINSPILPDPPPNVIYHTPCFAGKKGRDGLFPASACIKLTGTFDNTGEKLVVRHCAMDSGTLTQDTELARMSHCGKFQFEGDLLRGCVLACTDDACNSSVSQLRQLSVGYMITILVLGVLLPMRWLS